jgi:hypothetical protein
MAADQVLMRELRDSGSRYGDEAGTKALVHF